MLGPLNGVMFTIHETTAAYTYVRKRVYAKRRAKSPRHWARMDKKYAKRYGMRAEPTAYLMDTQLSALGMGQVLVVHPALAPQYRAALARSFAHET